MTGQKYVFEANVICPTVFKLHKEEKTKKGELMFVIMMQVYEKEHKNIIKEVKHKTENGKEAISSM
jgi:hypothetical protein